MEKGTVPNSTTTAKPTHPAQAIPASSTKGPSGVHPSGYRSHIVFSGILALKSNTIVFFEGYNLATKLVAFCKLLIIKRVPFPIMLLVFFSETLKRETLHLRTLKVFLITAPSVAYLVETALAVTVHKPTAISFTLTPRR